MSLRIYNIDASSWYVFLIVPLSLNVILILNQLEHLNSKNSDKIRSWILNAYHVLINLTQDNDPKR